MGVYVTWQELLDGGSAQVVAPNVPAPLVLKVPTVPVGVGLDGVTVIVQVDAIPTVTGVLQTTVVVLGVSAARADGIGTARNRIAKRAAIQTEMEKAPVLISMPFFPNQVGL